VTPERKIAWSVTNSRGDVGFIVGKAARFRKSLSNCGLTSNAIVLNVDGEERCRQAQVGPVGDKIGSPVDQGEPKVSLT